MPYKDPVRRREYNRDWRRRTRITSGLVTCSWCLEEFTPQGFSAHQKAHQRDEAESSTR